MSAPTPPVPARSAPASSTGVTPQQRDTRIEGMIREQMETVRHQILQQTDSAFSAQANASLPTVLSFL